MLAETCRWISSFLLLLLLFKGSWQDFQNGSMALCKNARNHSDLRLFNDQALWRRMFALRCIKRLLRALWPLGGPRSKNQKTMFEGWCIYYPSNVIKHKHIIILTELAARGSVIPTASLLQLQSCAAHCVCASTPEEQVAGPQCHQKKCWEMKEERWRGGKRRYVCLSSWGILMFPCWRRKVAGRHCCPSCWVCKFCVTASRKSDEIQSAHF